MTRDEPLHGFEMIVANRISRAVRRKTAQGAEYRFGRRWQEFPELAKARKLAPDEREQLLFERLCCAPPALNFLLRFDQSFRYQVRYNCLFGSEIVEERAGRNVRSFRDTASRRALPPF